MVIARTALALVAAKISLALHTALSSEPRESLSLLDHTGHAVESDASTDRQAHRQAEQSLWLSGKSRQVLSNYNDVQYVAFMEVGGQTISGIVDTGSFELAVFSTACETCGQAAKYTPALSPNHARGKLTSRQIYGSGGTTSQEAVDMVSIGPYAPKLQSFWEVIAATMPVLDTSGFQAIIGVGPPETPSMDAEARLKAVVQNISKYNEAGLEVPSELLLLENEKRKLFEATQKRTVMLETFGTKMFSICFGKEPNSDGYMIWNDTAPLMKPDYFKRVPVVGKHTWSVSLGGPQFEYPPTAKDKWYDGGSLGCEGGCGALLDSGTSIMAMPGPVLNHLVMLTLQPGFNCSRMWEMPSIKLKLGDHEVSLPPDTFISEVVDSYVPEYLQSFVRLRRLRSINNGSSRQRPGGRCDLMVMESTASSPRGQLWILGAPFFRQYYTTFEVSGRSNQNRAVHLARASDTCTPAAPGDNPKFPPRSELYQRLIDPAKLWVPASIQSALRSDYVFL